jgi:4-oxalomesaconate tautomerase
MHLRGGSSKGLYFNAKDLPTDEATRNRVILAAIEGSDRGDARQIDGLGGGSALSSKVAIIAPSHTEEADLDYFFVQVMVGKGTVSTTQTCGNILAGVLPFAIESGMIEAHHPTTTAKINIVNTGGLCEVMVETLQKQVNYAGNTRIDGVLGTAAPIVCNYLDTEGATCGALLPTGNAVDTIDGKELTCVDNGMPVVLLRAVDFGLSGYETKEALDSNDALKIQLESIRLQAGKMMNLGNVAQQSIPKMCLLSPPQYAGGLVNTRMFIPHVCHDAIGVLAAVSVATVCLMPHSIAENIATLPFDNQVSSQNFSVEHPSGELTVSLEFTSENGRFKIQKSGVIRTARLLSRGEVFVPIGF